MPDTLTIIGSQAFYSSYLKTVVIGSGVKTIGSGVFSHNLYLESVTILEGVTTIDYDAFYDCDNLTSITIPNSVTKLGSGAFCNSARLITVNLGNSIAAIENETFQTVPFMTVTYDGNDNTGGSIPVDRNTYLQGESAIVLANSGSLEKTG